MRQRNFQRCNGAALPAQAYLRMRRRLDYGDDDFLQQSAQQFFAVAIRSRRRRPDLAEIHTHPAKALDLIRTETTRLLVLAPAEFIFCGSEVA